jgi:hypothetical protein
MEHQKLFLELWRWMKAYPEVLEAHFEAVNAPYFRNCYISWSHLVSPWSPRILEDGHGAGNSLSLEL